MDQSFETRNARARRSRRLATWPCAGAGLAVLLASLSVTAGHVEAGEWLTYGNGLERNFYNSAETTLDRDNISRLGVKWTFRAGAIITAQTSVATITVAGEGEIAVAFIQSWDNTMYALRMSDGSELWRFDTEVGDGVSYPNVGSVHVEELGGVDFVFFGAGQNVFRLEAATGTEIWRFQAGTGCQDPPGLCGFNGERNEVETSPLIVDGKVIFGMDTNDRETGKGGAYAVDVDDGRLVWFFDLESGATCTPDPGDDIRRFDGYHSESDLGLPAGFLATRSGCSFDRTPTGCGNIWASPAADTTRQLLYWASSNCDTDNDPLTNRPPPPMPPYDAAIFALHYDGTPAWRWRPRETDNADLAFGATPQLFTIDSGGGPRDVVGEGNKDGNYYVIDRDGVNEVNGVAWDDADPSTLPYWVGDYVPGGSAGGITGTPAVDQTGGVIYIGTAPGFDPLDPQQPTLRAVDINDGSVIWTNSEEPDIDGIPDASFSPVTATDELVLIGSVPGGNLRVFDTATGEKIAARPVGFTVSSGITMIDGTVLVGGGTGQRSSDPDSIANITSMIAHDVTALCALGAPGCPARLAGKKLLVKDRATAASKRKLVYLAKDVETVVSPNPESDEDPTMNGATLTLSNPLTQETDTYSLPPSGWAGIGNPPGIKGYKYKDGSLANGPCKGVQIKAGKLVKAKCQGDGMAFTLDEASQGELAIALRIGPGGAWRYCSVFGGTITKDAGSGVTGDKGDFKSKSADRPTSCP
ncbi:MAG: PQQ-binding-like beta-propeller repeat protein [Candidatus Binatia bacterium]